MDAADLADELAIRRLLAEYCHCVDDGRFDDVVALFTPDGVFAFGSLGAEGRDALRTWFAETHPPEQRGKHLTTNTVVDLDGDRAHAVSDFAFLGLRDARLVPSVAGRYHDELRRDDDGRWRIARRDAVPMARPGT